MERLSAEWEGLRSEAVEVTGRQSGVDVNLAQSLLVLHQRGRRAFRVRTDGYARSFVARENRLDYYPAGPYEAMSCGPQPARAVIVQIPTAFENCVVEEGKWGTQMAPRYQFQDRRLEALVLSLVHAMTSGMAAPGAVLLSVAIVDRLCETARPNAVLSTPLGFTPTVKRLIAEYVDHHIGSAADLDRVAFLTGLARSQFGRLFRESFGAPMHQFVIRRKIEIATKLLLNNARVTDVALQLGFSSHAHFSTVFHRHTGLSPSSFRRESPGHDSRPGAQALYRQP
jgi:AraC-like DNA-binding protein